MFTDGVTTRDETIAQVADYAAQRSVMLWFVGIGDENELRDLKLHDLEYEEEIYLGDRAVFTVRLSGHGYKDLVVPVIFKIKTKDGKEKELAREMTKVEPNGRVSRIRFADTPKEVGPHEYIIEVEPPKTEQNEKPIPAENLRLTGVVRVIDTKKINVLYVEGQPRYEFRYLKFLMEREIADDKENKKKSIELTVLLLDADKDWAAKDNKAGKGTDKSAISVFPPTLAELNKYDVVVIGDCDPEDKKLKPNLKNIVHYVRGEGEDGKKANKKGGGLLFMGGVFHNPHQYKGTPLAAVIPVIPLLDKGPPDILRVEKYQPQLTPAGKMHPIFRFTPDEAENLMILERLTPMFWYSSKYKISPAAQVLAVHPTVDSDVKILGADNNKLPLVVEQYVGDGRSMFFGFDETWRWRKEDESKFNTFWIQTMRYLSRGRSTQTKLRLDRQTPYRLGDTIKVTVNFPDSTPGGNGKDPPDPKKKVDVKVAVEYFGPDAKEPELQYLDLAKDERSWGTYEGQWPAGREGKYRFRLNKPDVHLNQPDKKQPSAEAVVELPPGELDKLRLNYQDLQQASGSTLGKFYTLAKANDLLDDLPLGPSIAITTQVPPTVLWNHWLAFAAVLFLITSEWVLRKFKHLL